MGGAYSIGHAACLAAQLPPDSRTFVASDPLCEYASTTNRLLALIEYHAHSAWWMQSEDARKGRNQPRLVFQLDKGKQGTAQGESLTIEEITTLLAKPRKGVQHG